MVLIRRSSRAATGRRKRERDYHATQAEFAGTMAVVEGEGEAHDLLKRHLERSLPGSTVTVLNRNNSDDRLEAVTVIAPASGLNETLAGARPRSCVAVRLGRAYDQGDATEGLVSCEICGKQPGQTSCRPLLVSGKVIGSVLVEHDQPLGESDRRRLSDSVSQAAPVLANLRNLAVAESRAATDHLTGLPNRRALQDNLRRMAAQAARSGESLAAIVIDVDHFKQINDTAGHLAGDSVLRQLAALLEDAVRKVDIVARYGGEEFVAILPETASDGGVIFAERLRERIGAQAFEVGVDRPVHLTVSIGIATFPSPRVASTEDLFARADEALYRAKSGGRNQVRT